MTTVTRESDQPWDTVGKNRQPTSITICNGGSEWVRDGNGDGDGDGDGECSYFVNLANGDVLDT